MSQSGVLGGMDDSGIININRKERKEAKLGFVCEHVQTRVLVSKFGVFW